MQIEHIKTPSHEALWRAYDAETGFLSYIAVHRTVGGKSLGGVRMQPYLDESLAMQDVLRLSEHMSYKAMLADLPLGGAKCVVVQQPKTPVLWAQLGAFINHLQGTYIAAEDAGINLQDITALHAHTQYVVGTAQAAQSPAPSTALGVFLGLQEAWQYLSQEDMQGKKIWLQGVGSVGKVLREKLAENHATLFLSDLHAPYSPNPYWHEDLDVFCPCALGGVLNQNTILALRAKLVAGAANNQLENEARDSALLAEKGIVYVPDFLINAGGLIHVAQELWGFDIAKVHVKVLEIPKRISFLLAQAQKDKISPYLLAKQIAVEKLAKSV
jgi:leucine dehydrogenase